MLDDFSVMKVPDAFDLEYIQQFTGIANSLDHLSTEISRLSDLLNREYADRILATVQGGVAKQ